MIKPNYEAEQAVIGVIMMDAAKAMPIVETIVTPDEFYIFEFKRLYTVCHDLYKASKPIDAVTVLSIIDNGASDTYKQIIATAAAATPTISNLAEYAQDVHERAQKIQAYDKAAELLEALDNNEGVETCQEIAEEILKCFDSGDEQDTVSAEQGFLNFCERQDTPKKYISTGFSKLDKYLYIDRGDFLIFGGRPSSGKTALTLQIMLHMAREYNVAYFSCETKPEKIFDRLISNFDGISLNKIKTNSIEDEEWNVISDSFPEFKKLKFHIVHAAGMTVGQIKAKAREATLSGRVIPVSPLPAKALSPMEVSLPGSRTEVSAVQPSNACAPIFVTESGITRLLIGE